MFARTKRLLLRPGWAEDAEALQAAIADPAIIRNLVQAPWPYETADAHAFLAKNRDPIQPTFLIFNRTQGAPRLVGACGVHQEANDTLSLGYWIARPYWGLGFATEAAGAVMQIVRSSAMGRVVAGHFVDNPASGRVLTKLGFHPTGRVEKRFSAGRNAEVDTVLFEDGGMMPVRTDPAVEIYADRAIAA